MVVGHFAICKRARSRQRGSGEVEIRTGEAGNEVEYICMDERDGG